MKSLLLAGTLVMMGCTTAHDLGNGKFLVPRAIEERSLFGTNMGFAWIESCDGQADPKQPGMLYRNCEAVTQKIPMSSQGQGGQVVSGALQMIGLFGLGALLPGGSVNQSPVNSSSPTAVSVINQGHGHK